MILDSARLSAGSPTRLMTVQSFAHSRTGGRGTVVPSAASAGLSSSLRLPKPDRTIPGIGLGVR
jgi:hypothetical protein